MSGDASTPHPLADLGTEAGARAASTFDHLARLVAKRDKIDQALADASDAFVCQLERVADDLDVEAKVAIWVIASGSKVKHLSNRAARAMGTTITEMTWARDFYQPGSDRTDRFSGGFPVGYSPQLPRKGHPCVYMLFDAEGRCLYVGQSIDVRNRLRTHHSEGRIKPTSYEVVRCSSPEEAWNIEGDLIFQHKPPFNKVGTKTRRKPRQAS